jgi:hypothetical protein
MILGDDTYGRRFGNLGPAVMTRKKKIGDILTCNTSTISYLTERLVDWKDIDLDCKAIASNYVR